MDFTLKKYKTLLMGLKAYGDIFLRYDVDLKPNYSQETARIGKSSNEGDGILPC